MAPCYYYVEQVTYTWGQYYEEKDIGCTDDAGHNVKPDTAGHFRSGAPVKCVLRHFVSQSSKGRA